MIVNSMSTSIKNKEYIMPQYKNIQNATVQKHTACPELELMIAKRICNVVQTTLVVLRLLNHCLHTFRLKAH